MKSSFQTILTVVFLVVFASAILIFSGLLGNKGPSPKNNKPQGNVEIWGVLSGDIMQRYFDNFNISNNGYTVNYLEHNPFNFKQDLINALADGIAPDAVIINSEILSQIKDRLYTTPFVSFNERTFRDTYIDGAQIFINSEGISAFPLLVDPLVVFYNKDILANSNFIVPPRTWNNLSASISSLTKLNNKNSLTQSAIGLGQYKNVNNARDILSALFLQSGNSIISYDSVSKKNIVDLSKNESSTDDTPVSAKALSFYTSFSNPTNSNYSWNSGLPNNLEVFLSGKSAFYIGRSSELFAIQSKNPNLNFDVMEFFQRDNSPRPITYGSFIAIATLKTSKNPVAGYNALLNLSSSQAIDILSKDFSIPPARKDLLLINPPNPYTAVFFRAALSSFSWLDPEPNNTERIFRDMIENVNSGKKDPQSAIYEAIRNF